MVRYNIDSVSDDMVLGQSIALPSGKLLLNAGYPVTKRYRERLKQLGYQSVLVQEPGTEDIVPETLVSEKKHSDLNNSLNASGQDMARVFKRLQIENGKDFHRKIDKHRKELNALIMNPSISAQLEDIIEQITGQPEIVLNLAALKKTENHFFQHTVDVTITALCIAKKYDFTLEEVRQLGIGALNYHMGLTVIPENLLERNREYTEEERKQYRDHTVYGYLMLAQNSRIPPTSAIVALQHHEFQNGKGYPLKLKGNNSPPVKNLSQTHVIHRFAEIVACSDAYHTFLDHAGGTIAQRTTDSLRKIIQLSGYVLNRDITKKLVSIIPVYPVGVRIRVTRAPSRQLMKYIGVVARDNPNDLSRPVLLLYRTVDGEHINPPLYIECSKTRNIDFELLD